MTDFQLKILTHRRWLLDWNRRKGLDGLVNPICRTLLVMSMDTDPVPSFQQFNTLAREVAELGAARGIVFEWAAQ